MKSEHLERARAIISARRNRAHAINEEHFTEVNARIPEIVEINRQLFQTSRSILNIIRSGKDVTEQIEHLRRQNQQAQQMARQLLTMHGYPENYLEIVYTCPKCSDTGYYQGTYCSCLTELTAQIAAEELNKNAQINLCSFDTFDLSYYANQRTENGTDCYKAMESIFLFCKEYAQHFTKTSPSILMYGETGLGKTHLSLSIASAALDKGYSVLYDSVINFLLQIEHEHFGRDQSGNDTLSLLLSCDLLILDDLGTEFDSPFYQSVIYNIINTRMNRCLPTIISTNLDYNGISYRYNERITSRLFTTYVPHHFVGRDVRALRAQRKSVPKR